MRTTMAVFLLTMLLFAASPSHAADDATLALGRALSEQFEKGDTAPIYERMTREMRNAVGSAAGLAAFREKVLRDAGPETGVIREDSETQGSFRIYRRIARRNVGATPVLMEWVLLPDGRIAGFQVRPQPIAIPSSKLESDTMTAARTQAVGPQ